jgi:hypothetical protein
MDRLFVVKAVSYRLEDSADPPVEVGKLGFSMVRLMQLSGGEATGVRANLQVTDPAALNDLASHYTNNTWLEWTFEIGGSGGTFSVVLRWTKFDRLAGTLQVVRTAVLRDLIREAEGHAPPTAAPPNASSDSASVPARPANRASAPEREATAPPQAATRDAPEDDDRSLAQSVASLWPRLFGTKEPLDADPVED